MPLDPQASIISDKDKIPVEKETLLRDSQLHDQHLQMLFEKKENELKNIQQTLQDQENRLKDSQSRISDLEALINKKHADLVSTAAFIDEVQNSPGYKLIGKIRYWKDRVFLGRQTAPTGSPADPSTGSKNKDSVIDLAVCTVASLNYLSFLRTFAATLRGLHPGIAIYVLIVDKKSDRIQPRQEPFEILWVEELGNIPDPSHFFFKYSVVELNTAVKPFFFEHLFKKFGLEKLVFFDPDVAFFGRLDELSPLLSRHTLVLTPHLLSPYPDQHAWPSELQINRTGVFNLGFIGMSHRLPTLQFLKWWQQKLYDHCYMDLKRGMHVDQKWINLAVTMFEDVFILRDRRYNIAYWNLHQTGKDLRFDGKDLILEPEKKPVIFFHFSGFDSENPDQISRHQNRFRLKDLPNLKPLFEHYGGLLKKNGHQDLLAQPYAFDYFDNGVRIPLLAKKIYKKLGSHALNFGNPFSTQEKNTFYRYLSQPHRGTNGHRRLLTRLVWEIYQSRPDVQKAYPDPSGKNRKGFIGWLRNFASKECGLDASFVDPICAQTAFSVTTIGQRIGDRLKHRFFQKKSPGLGVNIAGYHQGEFGLAEAGRCYVRALETVSIPTVLNLIEADYHRHADRTFGHYRHDNPYPFNLVCVNADQAQAFALAYGQSYFHRKINIGLWFWELEQFPDLWQSSFDYYDEIWVATTFCQKTVAAKSPIPVVRIGHPVFIQKMPPQKSKFGFRDDDFIFLFHFDFLSYFERKNPLDLAETFKKTFKDKPRIHLLIKSINSRQDPAGMNRLRAAAQGSNILLMDKCLPAAEMAQLMNSCDCFVSLHRSEGFGQGLAHAMALGKPAIATAYSGNMDFMNPQNSYLVNYSLIRLQENHGPYQKGNLWAQPDLDHAGDLMRSVIDNAAEARKKATQAQADIKRLYDGRVIGEQIKGRLLCLQKQRR